MTPFGGIGFNNSNPFSSNGTVFRLATNGVFTTLVEFDGTNGRSPMVLVKGTDGMWYGTTTRGGGAFGRGTVFRMTRDGVLTTLFAFAGTNGASPEVSFFQSSDGNF